LCNERINLSLTGGNVEEFGEDKRTRSVRANIHYFSHTETQIVFPFIFNNSAICSYVHRDTEEVTDTFVSGKIEL
jgi:hypothetical protein